VSVPTIAPGKTRKAEFVLEADHFVGISQVPIGLSFKLTAADGSVLNEYAFRVDFSWFTSVLKPPTFDPKVYDLPLFNVLLFGLAGAGKSSFINSVMRYTQSSRSETGRASEPVSGGGDHCTVTLRSVEGSGLPLALWDTWGLTPKTYRGNELEMLMKGKLPSEWHKDDDVSLATTDESVEYENMPHALLFLLPQGMLHDTDGEIMQDIKTRFLNIVREGINPIVVITKLDEAEPQLKQDWSCCSKIKDDARNAAASALGIPVGNVYTVMNYIDDFSERNGEIDRTLFQIIHRVLSMSKQYLSALEQRRTTRHARPGVPLIKQKLLACEEETEVQRKKVGRERHQSEKLQTSVARCEDESSTLKTEANELKDRIAVQEEQVAALKAEKMSELEKFSDFTEESRELRKKHQRCVSQLEEARTVGNKQGWAQILGSGLQQIFTALLIVIVADLLWNSADARSVIKSRADYMKALMIAAQAAPVTPPPASIPDGGMVSSQTFHHMTDSEVRNIRADAAEEQRLAASAAEFAPRGE